MANLDPEKASVNSPKRVAEDILSNTESINLVKAEIGVWGFTDVSIDPGKVGVLSTGALNGCHASAIVAELPDGERRISMTHFPPDIGASRYESALYAIAGGISSDEGQVTKIISLIASDRYPHETELLDEIFPDADRQEISYIARDQDRKAQDSAGEVFTLLDNRDTDKPQLVFLSDGGDFVFTDI